MANQNLNAGFSLENLFSKKQTSNRLYYTINPLFYIHKNDTLDDILFEALIKEKSIFAERKHTFFRNKYIDWKFFQPFKVNLSKNNTNVEVPINFVLYIAFCIIATDQDLRDRINFRYPNPIELPNFIVCILDRIRINNTRSINIHPQLSSSFMENILKFDLEGTIWDINELKSNQALLDELLSFITDTGLRLEYNDVTKTYKPQNFTVNNNADLSSLTTSINDDGTYSVDALPFTSFSKKAEGIDINQRTASYAILFNTKVFYKETNIELKPNSFENGLIISLTTEDILNTLYSIFRYGNPGLSDSKQEEPIASQPTMNLADLNAPLGSLKFMKNIDTNVWLLLIKLLDKNMNKEFNIVLRAIHRML